MKTSTSTLLPVIATIGALGGCEWIAGIENTTVGVDAMSPADAALPADAPITIPDSAITIPDASGNCVEGCIEDSAFSDFNDVQGGLNGRWRYVEIQTETDSYVDMTPFTFSYSVLGFMGTGTPAPSLAYCVFEEPVAPCLELQGSLALTTTAPDAHHPALLWIAPESGRYSVDISYRASSVAPAVETTMTLTHNSQSNIVESETSIISTVASSLYTESALEAGDILVISAIATTATSVPVGVNVVIVGPY